MGLALAGASPAHLAVRGKAQADSVRCAWRGVARTLEQREAAIRFWLGLGESTPLPSPADAESQFLTYVNGMDPRFRDTMEVNFKTLAQGGISTDSMFLACYADYSVHEYLLGAGAATVTVAYDGLMEGRSYDLYKRSHAGGLFGLQPLMDSGEYEAQLRQTLRGSEELVSGMVGDRESVVFLAPMGAHNAIAIEAWQMVDQWDLQTDDQGVVHAVRYGTLEGDPEHTQTLANLTSRITEAAATDAFAGNRIGNVGGLNQYYRDIGAYGDITPGDGIDNPFTPAQPPPAPAG